VQYFSNSTSDCQVREYIRDASNDRSALARHLCLKAKDAGSTDNITVVIIFLRENINLSEVLPNEVDVPVEKSEGMPVTETVVAFFNILVLLVRSYWRCLLIPAACC